MNKKANLVVELITALQRKKKKCLDGRAQVMIADEVNIGN